MYSTCDRLLNGRRLIVKLANDRGKNNRLIRTVSQYVLPARTDENGCARRMDNPVGDQPPSHVFPPVRM